MYLYIFLFTKPLKSSTLAADFKIEMKNISILYIMKQLLVSIAIVFASILTVTGQNHSFNLSGKWNFQIDREDIGRTDGVQNYMDLKYCPCSLSLRRLGDTLSLRGKLFRICLYTDRNGAKSFFQFIRQMEFPDRPGRYRHQGTMVQKKP